MGRGKLGKRVADNVSVQRDGKGSKMKARKGFESQIEYLGRVGEDDSLTASTTATSSGHTRSIFVIRYGAFLLAVFAIIWGHQSTFSRNAPSSTVGQATTTTGGASDEVPRDRLIPFVNDGNDQLGVYWRNPDTKKEQRFSLLNAGQNASLHTFTGHVWVLRTSDGRAISAYRVNNALTLVKRSGRGTVNLAAEDIELQISGDEKDKTGEMAVKFVNNARYVVELFWVKHRGDTELRMTELKPRGGEARYNTFTDHIWTMRRKNGKLVRSVVIDEYSHMSPVYSNASVETAFHRKYLKKKKRAWKSVFPRPVVTHPVHDKHKVGESFVVESSAPYLHEPIPLTAANNGTVTGELKLSLKVLSLKPLIITVDNMLSDFECDHIIQETLKSGGLKRSTVTTKATVIETRTSSNAWMPFTHDKVLEHVYRRGFDVMGIPFNISVADHIAESLQVLRYETHQKYDPHHDYFDPFEERYLADKIMQSGYNRLATLFLYLTDVEEGGETVFPDQGGRHVANACTHADGFRVKPRRGSAVLFYSMLPDGNLDVHSLHGGCPVINGTKWAANWWFWDPFRDIVHNPEHGAWKSKGRKRKRP